MDKVAFEVFGVAIAWYGILIALGMLAGTLILVKLGKKFGYKENDLYDLAIWVLPAAVIGARVYYVIFEWDQYGGDIMRMINFREGGMAIHGGVLGGLLAGYIVCKVKKMNFWQLADCVVPGLILGQAIGRWGNFINQEAHGGPTDLPWGILVDGVRVHPTFLYESFWNLLVFGLLLFLFKKRKANGELLGVYFVMYSLGRFFIEGLRTDSLYFMGMRVAQLISIALILVGILIIYVRRKKHPMATDVWPYYDVITDEKK